MDSLLEGFGVRVWRFGGGFGGFRGLGCRVLRCRVEGLGWYIGFGFRAEGCLGF